MTREIYYVQAINEAVREEMAANEKVVVLGEDVRVSPFGQMAGLADVFGDRVINTPIAESAIIGTAIGLAMTGMRPVAELMLADFAYLAMDQIANQAGQWRYMTGGQVKVPMVIRTLGGGGWGLGYNHSQCTEASFLHAPGLKIAVPSTPYDAKGLLKQAIRDDNPVLFFEHKLLLGMTGEVPAEDYTVEFGKARIARRGRDVTVVAIHYMVHKALQAAEELATEGVDVEIIDPRTLVPLDLETILASLKKTGRLVIVEESRKQGGVGAEITAMVIEEGFDLLNAPILRVGAPSVPIPCSLALEQFYLPGVQSIKSAIREVLE